MDFSFKKFLEYEEAPNDYIHNLSRDLDVDPQSIADSPQWLAGAKIGNFTYGGTTYTMRYVKNGMGNITGAMIKPMDSKAAFWKSDNGMVRSPDKNPDTDKEFFVPREKLMKMLNQEVGSTPPPSGMGGMPGMPPGM